MIVKNIPYILLLLIITVSLKSPSFTSLLGREYIKIDICLNSEEADTLKDSIIQVLKTIIHS